MIRDVEWSQAINSPIKDELTYLTGTTVLLFQFQRKQIEDGRKESKLM